MEYYYNLRTQILPDKRTVLEELIASAKQEVLSPSQVLTAVPMLMVGMLIPVCFEPVHHLIVQSDGSLVIDMTGAPWAHLHPAVMATFLSYFCQAGGLFLVNSDGKQWGYRFEGPGTITHLRTALVDEAGQLVEWL